MTVYVTVYTAPGCPGCGLTRRHLDKLIKRGAHLEVTEKPLDDFDRDAAISLGFTTAPVVCAEAQGATKAFRHSWDGYRPDQLDALGAIA